MIVVVLGGFHCLWWYSVVFTICGGLGWFSMCVVGFGGFVYLW